jgi:hypothetical protein
LRTSLERPGRTQFFPCRSFYGRFWKAAAKSGSLWRAEQREVRADVRVSAGVCIQSVAIPYVLASSWRRRPPPNEREAFKPSPKPARNRGIPGLCVGPGSAYLRHASQHRNPGSALSRSWKASAHRQISHRQHVPPLTRTRAINQQSHKQPHEPHLWSLVSGLRPHTTTHNIYVVVVCGFEVWLVMVVASFRQRGLGNRPFDRARLERSLPSRRVLIRARLR